MRPAAAGASLLRVTTADYDFQAPDTIQASVTTIRLVNRGPSRHHVQLVRLDQGKSLPDFLTALKAGGPPPPWAVMIGGPNSPVPGDSSTAIIGLDPGRCAMVCFIPAADGEPHFAKGMVHLLTVTAPASAAVEPASDVTVKLSEFDFTFSTPLTAGHHTIRVENDGQPWQEMVLVRLNPGRTIMDFAGWAAKEGGPEVKDGKARVAHGMSKTCTVS